MSTILLVVPATDSDPESVEKLAVPQALVFTVDVNPDPWRRASAIVPAVRERERSVLPPVHRRERRPGGAAALKSTLDRAYIRVTVTLVLVPCTVSLPALLLRLPVPQAEALIVEV